MRVIPDDVHGALAVWAESRGEPWEGQLAVASVIRERMRLRYSSNGTVIGTVWRPKQFSWTMSADPQRAMVLAVDDQLPSWQEAMKAWLESATKRPLPPQTVLYHAASMPVAPYWTKAPNVKFVKQIGGHRFFKDEEA